MLKMIAMRLGLIIDIKSDEGRRSLTMRNIMIMNELVKLLLLKHQMIMMMKQAPFQHANIKNYCLQVGEKFKETSSVLNFEGF